MDNVFGNLFGSLGGLAPKDPYQDLLKDYYDPKAAKWSMVGSALSGLGTGLMTRDWAKAAEVSGQGMSSYRDNAMKRYAAAEMMSAAEEKKQKRQEEAEAKKQRDAFMATLPPAVRMKAMSIPGYLDSYIEATDPNLQQPEAAPSSVQEYEYAKGNGFGGSFEDWKTLGGGGESNVSAQVAERQAAAQSLGLDPNDPAYKSYILTGKMPREDQAPLTATDKKAILEADDAVMVNQTVIDQLESVINPGADGKSINDTAGYGWNADIQSWLARNDGKNVFDDRQGQATTELKNIVLGQALSSLKSTFGAAPTEGERKILIDLQASVDKTPKERGAIIKRAIDLAKMRLKFNEERAKGLRGQTYYKPGGNQSGSVGTVPDGVTPQEWNAMTPEERAAWE